MAILDPNQFIGGRLLGSQHKLRLAQQAIAGQGHFENHHIIQGVHQLDVHGYGLHQLRVGFPDRSGS